METGADDVGGDECGDDVGGDAVEKNQQEVIEDAYGEIKRGTMNTSYLKEDQSEFHGECQQKDVVRNHVEVVQSIFKGFVEMTSMEEKAQVAENEIERAIEEQDAKYLIKESTELEKTLVESEPLSRRSCPGCGGCRCCVHKHWHPAEEEVKAPRLRASAAMHGGGTRVGGSWRQLRRARRRRRGGVCDAREGARHVMP